MSADKEVVSGIGRNGQMGGLTVMSLTALVEGMPGNTLDLPCRGPLHKVMKARWGALHDGALPHHTGWFAGEGNAQDCLGDISLYLNIL